MSFRYEGFYLIEPRPELADHLRGRVEPEFADLLMQPVLLRGQENSGSAWLHADRLAQVKLLFLASLTEYIPVTDPDEFEAMLGSSRLSVTLFDRWWVGRRLQVDQELELLEPRLGACLGQVDTAGDPRLGSWLAALRAEAERGAAADGGA